MDDVVNRLARELSDAIASALAEDAKVEACRERARAAGFEMKLSLEAIIGFVNRTQPGAITRAAAPQQKALTHHQRRNVRDQRQRPALSSVAADCRRRDAGEGSRVGRTSQKSIAYHSTNDKAGAPRAGLFVQIWHTIRVTLDAPGHG